MKSRIKLAFMGAAFGIAALGSGTAPAQDVPTVVTQRQDAMKAQGRALTAIRNFVEDKGDLPTAQAAGGQLVQSLQGVQNLFPQKTSLTEFPGKTRAKAEIWAAWDKFVAADQAAATNTLEDPIWRYGFLFSAALTIGGGTGEVQRNIVAERVLGLPHDIDVEQGKTWREARVAS